MSKIIISQQGIEHTIIIPEGDIRIESPHGGNLELDKPIRIVALDTKSDEKLTHTVHDLLESFPKVTVATDPSIPEGELHIMDKANNSLEPIQDPLKDIPQIPDANPPLEAAQDETEFTEDD